MHRLSRRVFCAAAAAAAVPATRAAAATSDSAWDFSFPSIDDGVLRLADYRGQVLLVVNTASFCGFTYEYEGLQTLYHAAAARGLVVVGVPSQDFNQESSSNGAVKQFCEATFGVEFPMAGLSHVLGPQAAPFYQWVKRARGWEPAWNFNKVLVARDGAILATYGAGEEPGGRAVSGAIEAALTARA